MQGKADDTGGLTPTKDDNEVLQKSGPRQMKVSDLGSTRGCSHKRDCDIIKKWKHRLTMVNTPLNRALGVRN